MKRHNRSGIGDRASSAGFRSCGDDCIRNRGHSRRNDRPRYRQDCPCRYVVRDCCGAILIVGFSRAVYAAKGWAYYSHNLLFWAKIGTFAVIGLLSIAPTMSIIALAARSARQCRICRKVGLRCKSQTVSARRSCAVSIASGVRCRNGARIRTALITSLQKFDCKAARASPAVSMRGRVAPKPVLRKPSPSFSWQPPE